MLPHHLSNRELVFLFKIHTGHSLFCSSWSDPWRHKAKNWCCWWKEECAANWSCHSSKQSQWDKQRSVTDHFCFAFLICYYKNLHMHFYVFQMTSTASSPVQRTWWKVLRMSQLMYWMSCCQFKKMWRKWRAPMEAHKVLASVKHWWRQTIQVGVLFAISGAETCQVTVRSVLQQKF